METYGQYVFYHIHALIFNISYVFVMSKLPIKICSGLNHIITFKNSHSQHFSTYFIAYLDSVWDSSFWNLWDIPLVHLQSLHMLKNRKRKHSFRRAKWSYSASLSQSIAFFAEGEEERSFRRGPYNLQMWASWQEKKWGDPQLGLVGLQSECMEMDPHQPHL